ncbi:hypothetical protein D3C80_617270 [compost metagenome]
MCIKSGLTFPDFIKDKLILIFSQLMQIILYTSSFLSALFDHMLQCMHNLDSKYRIRL